MNRFSHAVSLVVILGCEQSSTKWPEPIEDTKSELIEVESIRPGTRPRVIDGARYFKAPEIFDLDRPGDPQLSDKPWVAVEGTVRHSFDRFGAPCVVLKCDDCPDIIDCEGMELGKYRFQIGQTVVIRGQLEGTRSLVKSRLIAQEEIDEALKAED
ncbi:MAG: hypothetical protein KDA84_08320 [Planctomycetaceae bacterium]|nr:hypothetical protein [Planctomycetaceae bacterium]